MSFLNDGGGIVIYFIENQSNQLHHVNDLSLSSFEP